MMGNPGRPVNLRHDIRDSRRKRILTRPLRTIRSERSRASLLAWRNTSTFPDDQFIEASLFESSLFLTSVGGPPDLSGFTITALNFRLTDLLVTDDDDSREVRYSGVVSVEGVAADPVPEPSTLLLLGTGAAVVMRRARRR